MSDQPVGPPPVPGGAVKTSGLAIASLVLALLFFVPLAPVAAVVLGILALVNISSAKGSLGGRRLAIAGLCISGAWLVIGCMVALLLPALSRTREISRSSMARDRLKQIGVCLAMYRNDHNEMPPNLQTLWDQQYLRDPNVFLHPAFGTRQVDPSAIDATGDYFYYQISKTGDETAGTYPSDAPIAWEKACWRASGRVNVLFSDGHVSALPPADLESAVAQYADLYQEPPQMPAALER